MRLIGMLDSPYVRKVAVTLEYLNLPFTHEAVSVFSTFEKFQSINPVVKAPTLVCDDGTVLMDSALIVQYAESTVPAEKSLWSSNTTARRLEFRAVSLAHAACDKSAQLVYEQNLRPQEYQFKPWMERVTGQLLAAYAGLERELEANPELFARERSHATLTAAIAWQFTQSMLAHLVVPTAHPRLCALSAHMEHTPCFRKYPPDGPGVPAGAVGKS